MLTEITDPTHQVVSQQPPSPSSNTPEEQPQETHEAQEPQQPKPRGPFVIRRDLVAQQFPLLTHRQKAVITILSILEDEKYPTEIAQPTCFVNASGTGYDDMTKDAIQKANMYTVYRKLRNRKPPIAFAVSNGARRGEYNWRITHLTEEILKRLGVETMVQIFEPELTTYLRLVADTHREENNGSQKVMRSEKSNGDGEGYTTEDDETEEDELEEDGQTPLQSPRSRQTVKSPERKVTIKIKPMEKEEENKSVENQSNPFARMIRSIEDYNASQNATFVDQHNFYSAQIVRIDAVHKRKREQDHEKLAEELRRRDERILKVSREFEKRMVEMNEKWEARYGDQNARITQLELEKSLQEEKSKEFSGHVARLETRIEELFTELSGVIETRHGECRNELEGIEKRVEDLRTSVQKFQGLATDQQRILQMVVSNQRR